MLKKNRLYGHRITMAVLSIAIIIGMVIPAFAKSSTYVASVGDKGYTSLQNAVDSVPDNGTGTILLLSDVTLSSTLSIGGGKNITVNLNGHSISKTDSAILIQNANVTFTGTGTIQETENDGYAPILIKGSKNEADTNYTVVTIGENVTLKGWAGVFIRQYNANNNSETSTSAHGVVVNFYGKITAPAAANHTVSEGAIYINGNIHDSVNCPVINICCRSKNDTM